MKNITLFIALFFSESIPIFIITHHNYGNFYYTFSVIAVFLIALSLVFSWFFADKSQKIIKNLGYIAMLAGMAFSISYFMNYEPLTGILIVAMSMIIGVNVSLRERRMLSYLLVFSFILFLYASSIVFNQYSMLSIVLFTFSFFTVVIADYYVSRIYLQSYYSYESTNNFYAIALILVIVVTIFTAFLYYLIPQPKAIHYGILPFGGKKQYKSIKGEENIQSKYHKKDTTKLPKYTINGKDTKAATNLLKFNKEINDTYTEKQTSIKIEKNLKIENKKAYYSSVNTEIIDKNISNVLFEVKGKEARFLRGNTYSKFNGKYWKKILTNLYTIKRGSKDYRSYWNGKDWKQRTKSFTPNDLYYNEYFTKKTDEYTITVKGKLAGKPIIYVPVGLLRLQFPTDTFYEDAARTIYAPSQLEIDTYYTSSVESEKYYGYDAMSYAAVWYKKVYSRPMYKLDNKISLLANKLTKNWNNSLEKAQAIVNYFKINYLYKHSSIKHKIQNQTLSEMLFKTKVGNALQFNTALIMMLRAKGEYARLATGYAPNEYNQETHSYIIERNNKAVWTELFVKGRGWVSIHAADDIPFDGEETNIEVSKILLTKNQLIFLGIFIGIFLIIFTYYSRKYIWTYLAKSNIREHTQRKDIDFVISTYKEVAKYYKKFHKGQKSSWTLQEYENYIKKLKPENSYLIEYLSFYSNQAIYKKELDVNFDKERYLEVALFLVDKPFELKPLDNYIAINILKYNDNNKNSIMKRYFMTNDNINRMTFFRRTLLITTILLVVTFVFIILMILFKIYPYQPIGYFISLTIIGTFYYSLTILTIKRLHDIKKSGWWSILLSIPYITYIFYLVILFVKGKSSTTENSQVQNSL